MDKRPTPDKTRDSTAKKGTELKAGKRHTVRVVATDAQQGAQASRSSWGFKVVQRKR